jgi:hypothetical protein
MGTKPDELPKEDPFEGAQGNLFSGGPLDPATTNRGDASAPGGSDASAAAGVSGDGAEAGADPAAAGGAGDDAPAESPETRLMRERLEKQDELIERMLTGQPAAREPARETVRVEAPGPQPDPVTKPAEFNQWLDRKLAYERHLTERAIELRDGEQTRVNTLDRLWSDFRVTHADAAFDEDLAGAAFLKVINGKYAGQIPRGNANKLLAEVATQVRTWVRAGGKPANGDARNMARTEGLSTPPGRKPSVDKSKSKTDDPPVPFATQIADLQMKTGFF